ncbi:hypothetical protein SESBI_20307 [Sesbania bispinosa]|nr:hypothetical protein SESBI_20307 [Sesbania bispinosa]
MHVLRVALFMMRSRSRKSSVLPIDDGSKSVWRKLVGSMRPLHLQSNQSPPSISISKTDNDVHLAPPSPSEYKTDCGSDVTEEEPYSPSPASSRYASAVGLNELVQSDEENEMKQEVIVEEENESEERCDNVDGDEMIDAKAEEFIAQFYKEMTLQRMNSADRCYHERSQRSLGL